MDKKNASSISFSQTFTKRHTIFLSVRIRENIQGYNPPINFHVILLATLRHVV